LDCEEFAVAFDRLVALDREGRTVSQHEDRNLFRRFWNCNDRVARNSLIEHYLPLVRLEAKRVARWMPKKIDLGDLVSAGYLGLIEALNSYHPCIERSISLRAYVRALILHTILDDSNSLAWKPRKLRRRGKG
jgi:RNA polymerase sigma factor FliA